jgi:hypothetical protein
VSYPDRIRARSSSLTGPENNRLVPSDAARGTIGLGGTRNECPPAQPREKSSPTLIALSSLAFAPSIDSTGH